MADATGLPYDHPFKIYNTWSTHLESQTNQRLPNFNPMPQDSEYTKYFNTLRVHNIDDTVNEGLIFSFGFKRDIISSAVDSLNYFDSETIAIMIGEYADSLVFVGLCGAGCETTYTDGKISRAIDGFNMSANQRKREGNWILENIPILTMIPHFSSFLWAIEKSSGVYCQSWGSLSTDDSSSSGILSTAWSHPWSKKQLFLANLFDPRADKPFDFSQDRLSTSNSDTVLAIRQLLEKVEQEQRKLKEECYANVASFEEYEKAEILVNEKLKSFQNPLKRRLEEMLGNGRSKKKKL